MGRPTKHQIQEFLGVRYYRKPSGYFKADPSAGGEYMHRAVWRHHHGEIPDGHHVHHVDEDRGHNAIGNLECLPGAEHVAMHSRKWHADNRESSLAHMDAIRPQASAWHGSPEGLAWHHQHGVEAAERLPVVRYACVRCGASYETKLGKRKRGYCSAACQSAARRESGADDETRTCVICSAPFTINRYAKTVTCGRACSAVRISRTKRARVRPDGG